MYLGFDRLSYPGDAVMESLRASGRVSFVAAYLAPAPSQPSTGWMPHVADLVAAGWGIAPVYVGQQAAGGPGSHVMTAEQGDIDAVDAAGLAATAGLADAAVVYLDIEQGGLLGADHLAYVEAWVRGMDAGAFRPGVYCSYKQTAQQVVDAVGDVPVWAFHPRGGPDVVDLDTEVAPDPGASGYAGATMWQYRMSLATRVDLTWTDGTGATRRLNGVDVDSSTVPDPSFPASDVTAPFGVDTGPAVPEVDVAPAP